MVFFPRSRARVGHPGCRVSHSNPVKDGILIRNPTYDFMGDGDVRHVQILNEFRFHYLRCGGRRKWLGGRRFGAGKGGGALGLFPHF